METEFVPCDVENDIKNYMVKIQFKTGKKIVSLLLKIYDSCFTASVPVHCTLKTQFLLQFPTLF